MERQWRVRQGSIRVGDGQIRITRRGEGAPDWMVPLAEVNFVRAVPPQRGRRGFIQFDTESEPRRLDLDQAADDPACLIIEAGHWHVVREVVQMLSEQTVEPTRPVLAGRAERGPARRSDRAGDWAPDYFRPVKDR